MSYQNQQHKRAFESNVKGDKVHLATSPGLGPPKKAWEFHYRSFLAKNGSEKNGRAKAENIDISGESNLSCKGNKDVAPRTSSNSHTSTMRTDVVGGIGASLENYVAEQSPVTGNKSSGAKIKSRIKSFSCKLSRRVNSQENIFAAAAAAAASGASGEPCDELDLTTSSLRRMYVSDGFTGHGGCVTHSWTPGTCPPSRVAAAMAAQTLYGSTPGSLATNHDSFATSLDSFGLTPTEHCFLVSGPVSSPPRNMPEDQDSGHAFDPSSLTISEDEDYFFRSPPSSPRQHIASQIGYTSHLEASYPNIPELQGTIVGYQHKRSTSIRSTSLCMIHESSNKSLEQSDKGNSYVSRSLPNGGLDLNLNLSDDLQDGDEQSMNLIQYTAQDPYIQIHEEESPSSDRGQKRQPEPYSTQNLCLDGSIRRGSTRKAARSGFHAMSPRKGTTVSGITPHHRTLSMGALTTDQQSPLLKATPGSHLHSTTKENSVSEKVRKLVFTKFHNSTLYGGKDSTSAFLGDESSIRAGREPRRSSDKPLNEREPYGISPKDVMDVEPKGPTPESVVNKVLARKEKPSRSPILNHLPYDSMDSPTAVLNAFENENSRGLISPIALMLICSLQAVPILPYIHCSGESREIHQRSGMIQLGEAEVDINSGNQGVSEHQTRKICYFALYHNYLLEYDQIHPQIPIIPKPCGYAHLQNASVRLVEIPSFSTYIELEFHEVHDPIVYRESQSNALGRKKIIIWLKSREMTSRWMELLTWACQVTTDSLYSIGQSTGMVLGQPGTGELGRGRYSTIYSASKTYFPQIFASDQEGWSSKSCALKVVSKDQFLYRVKRHRERPDTLLREVAIQSLLSRYISSTYSNPKEVPILQIANVFETRTHLVLDIELMSGEDLFTYISNSSKRRLHGGLPEEEARLIIINILQALTLLQKLGIAHRDVKPANIFMCDHKQNIRAKLADYGMATFIGTDGLVRGRCGTPGYVAPEILLSNTDEGYKNKVDAFSAGVTLYVMLCGYEPFFGESDEQLIAANKKAKIDFPSNDWGHVSSGAKELIKSLTHKDPEKRIDVEAALNHKWLESAPSTFRIHGSRNPTSYDGPSDSFHSGCILS